MPSGEGPAPACAARKAGRRVRSASSPERGRPQPSHRSSLTASAVRVSSSSVLEASTAGSVSVSGSEGVSVSSGGSLVRLSPEGEGEFVGFVWESARSFDSFENVVSPSVSDVEELVIVSGAGPYARGASEVSIDLYDGSSWVSVWSASLGAEAYYSLGGLSVRFASQSVSGVRVRSAPGLNPTFEGWSDVVIHFGRRSSGSVSVSSAWRIEASAGEEAVFAPIDTASDALGELAGDREQLGVDASRPKNAWLASYKQCPLGRTAGALTYTDRNVAPSLRSARHDKGSKHDPQARLPHRRRRGPRADALSTAATRLTSSATTGNHEPDPEVQQVQITNDRQGQGRGGHKNKRRPEHRGALAPFVT